METYTIASQAIQNAYADLNADVASGAIAACPVPDTLSFDCPVAPLIYAGAFFFEPMVGTRPNVGTSPYAATYPTDSYQYLGTVTVQNERTQFPPWGPQAGAASGLQNMNGYSVHMSSKTGAALVDSTTTFASNIASARPQPVPAALPTMPIVLSELAQHTSVIWAPLSSTSDSPAEASRLASQVRRGRVSAPPARRSGACLERLFYLQFLRR